MEEKLKEFKSRRRREMFWNTQKNLLEKIIEKISMRKSKALKESENEGSTLLKEKTNLENPLINGVIESSNSSNTTGSCFSIVTCLLYFILWVIVYLIAIQLEFGYVYLLLSGLLFIYFNTRTEPKKHGEISAYSVFNPGCKAIEGTLKAEQLEREFNLIQH